MLWIYIKKTICSFTTRSSREVGYKSQTKNYDYGIKWTAVNEWNIKFIPKWELRIEYDDCERMNWNRDSMNRVRGVEERGDSNEFVVYTKNVPVKWIHFLLATSNEFDVNRIVAGRSVEVELIEWYISLLPHSV